MNTDELLEDLALGELSNTVYTELLDTGFTIKDNFKPPLMQILNQGLVALYTRFDIRNEFINIQPDGRVTYDLVKANTVSSGNLNPFIMDTVQVPWRDNIGMITNINDDKGRRLAVGSRPIGHPAACRCPQCKCPVILQPYAKQLIIPKEVTDLLTIEYKALHPKIPVSQSYTNLELELPDSYKQALLYFIGNKLVLPKKDSRNNGESFNSLYEAECQKIMLAGQETKMNDSRDFIREHGFP